MRGAWVVNPLLQGVVRDLVVELLLSEPAALMRADYMEGTVPNNWTESSRITSLELLLAPEHLQAGLQCPGPS